MTMANGLLLLSLVVVVFTGSNASPTMEFFGLPTSSGATVAGSASASLNEQTYINKGLVAFGLIPSNFVESTGDTLGGIGSAIALKQKTWSALGNGSFKGTLVVQPDRGYNVKGTIDYQGRHHEVDFLLSPYYGTSNLGFADAQKTLQLAYRKTILHYDRKGAKTSGLDALAIRPAQCGYPTIPIADPEMPIPREDYSHLSTDTEGLVLNDDGSLWVSDEYGPYIYRFTADGLLVQTIQPPDAILPRHDEGALNFTSDSDPTTGRGGNQGFEGLTIDSATSTLYALLQSAVIQDGGSNKATARYTRLLAYDVSHAPIQRPQLVGEWVVPLPLSSKGKALGTSEVHFVGNGVFLNLARDSDGRGGGDAKSKYKQADLFDISNATDIHGTKFDDPSYPIAVNGVLDPSIKPATYIPFVNFIDKTQLARFGLHNGNPDDRTLIGAKWESLALAPCEDSGFPDDFFLFTASDNDFISTQGISLGIPFDAGLDNDNQFLVFRVTLPGARQAR